MSKNENTPFYLNKEIWITAVLFTLVGYYGLPKALDWYQNR